MASTERLHALLQSILAERDRFAAHLYQSRRDRVRHSHAIEQPVALSTPESAEFPGNSDSHQGTRTTEPVVRRASRSSCALRASDRA
jgi:hypothetical protein